MRFLLLLVIAVLLTYAVWLIIVGASRVRARKALEKERRAAIVRRADQQNQWVLDGDARGTYGGEPDPPAHDRSWIQFEDWRGRTVRPPRLTSPEPIAGRIDPVTGRKETIYRVYSLPDD